LNGIRFLCLFEGEETREAKLAQSEEEALTQLYENDSPTRVYKLDLIENTIADVSGEIAVKWWDSWIKSGADPREDHWPNFIWAHIPIWVYPEYLNERDYWATADGG
jgi:hypothetical protein